MCQVILQIPIVGFQKYSYIKQQKAEVIATGPLVNSPYLINVTHEVKYRGPTQPQIQQSTFDQFYYCKVVQKIGKALAPKGSDRLEDAMTKYLKVYFKLLSTEESFFRWRVSGITQERESQVQNILYKVIFLCIFKKNIKVVERGERFCLKQGTR